MGLGLPGFKCGASFASIYQVRLTNVPSFFGPSTFHQFLNFLEGFWEGFGRVWGGFGEGLEKVWGKFGKVWGRFGESWGRSHLPE